MGDVQMTNWGRETEIRTQHQEEEGGKELKGQKKNQKHTWVLAMEGGREAK